MIVIFIIVIFASDLEATPAFKCIQARKHRNQIVERWKSKIIHLYKGGVVPQVVVERRESNEAGNVEDHGADQDG